jgi:hypothetical protein
VRVAARARVAVLPCCHDFATCDAGRLGGGLNGRSPSTSCEPHASSNRAIDIWTQTIRSEITPKNRLLLGATPMTVTTRQRLRPPPS